MSSRSRTFCLTRVCFLSARNFRNSTSFFEVSIFSLTFSLNPSIPPSIASISALVLLFGLISGLSIESRAGLLVMLTIAPSCSPLHSPVSSSIRKPSSSLATLLSASLRRCLLSETPRFCISGTSTILSGVMR